MDIEYISQTAFLLVELRYTLTQLCVQLEDFTPEQCEVVGPMGRSVKQILRAMIVREKLFRSRYAKLLGFPLPESTVATAGTEFEAFKGDREETLAWLRSLSNDLQIIGLDAVKQHVAMDRQDVTEIANCRVEQADRDRLHVSS